MNKKEKTVVNEEKLQIYNGIIANNPLSIEGIQNTIKYSFDCPEFIELKEKYNLELMAGKGSDFSRAKRLLNYLAPFKKNKVIRRIGSKKTGCWEILK